MDTADFLAELRQRDVQVWAEGERLRCSAPPGVLDAETKAALAGRKEEILALLRRADGLGDRPPAIIPLKPSGSRPPLFAVPGHNGDVFCYLHLARRLDPEQPLLGVQPPGVDAGDPLDSLVDLARYEVEQIRRYRPHGPYLIAGYCAGGTLAFEVAQRLREQGQEVALLALFGSPFPSTYRLRSMLRFMLDDLRERAARHLRALSSGPLAARLQYVKGKLQRRRQEVRARPPQLDAAVLARRGRVERATLAAIRSYRERKYPGRIDLFVPSEAWQHRDVLQRWRAIAGALLEHVGPDGCTLDVMLKEPAVEALAVTLGRRLDEVNARAVDDAERRPPASPRSS